MEKFIAIIGYFIFLTCLWLASENKKKFPWRTVIWGTALQISLGAFILKVPQGQAFFESLSQGIQAILNYTMEGSRFVFGNLTQSDAQWGFLFFTMVLPTLIFVSSLTSVLYYLGIMQKVVQGFAWVMMRTMGVSGAEALAAAANIFVGQTEAPLLIKPYLQQMKRSELLSLMTGGMATVAGGVLVAYVGFGIDATHLLAASVMSAPAALMCAKILLPDVNSKTPTLKLQTEGVYANIIDAAAGGASEGLKLAAQVAAMLIAFIALIALVNGLLSQVGSLWGWSHLSLEWLLGLMNAPVAWLLGVPTQDIALVGSLLGKKLILNEFVAYVDLIKWKAQLQPRSYIIATYALCGFANFTSIAIQLGGIGTLIPARRQELARLGIKALFAGTLSCYLTACVASLFLD